MTANSSTACHSTPPRSVEATCQTSVLMKRKVMNSSSSGRARAASGSSNPSDPRVRRAAQPSTAAP